MPSLRTLLLSAVLIPVSVMAQPSPFAPTKRSATLQQKKETATRSRAVTVDARLFNPSQDGLSLTLFNDVKVIADRETFKSTKWGDVWTGKVRGGGTAIFVRNGDVVAGLVSLAAGKSYRVRWGGNKVHRITQLNKAILPDEAPPLFSSLAPRMLKTGGDSHDCTTDPPDEIDAMIVYTADARDVYGGVTAVEAECLLAVESANQAYINSDITQRLRLVFLDLVTYTESLDSETDLIALQGTTDGEMDDVHTNRDAHGADVVALITSEVEPDICGRAFVMSTVSSSMADEAFGVVRGPDCAVDNLSYAHEMAHIMGARHDWPTDSDDNQPYHYNHGYYNTAPTAGDAFRTIMSYNNDECDLVVGGCDRLQYFSNPNINEPVSGDPLGTDAEPEPTDNHLTLNNTAYTVANFRCSSPNAEDVWMKDTWEDTGLEPDPATTSQDMWKSPYIWVRNTQDATLVKQHQHQDPIAGTTNWVYVKMHNASAVEMNGELLLYYANADASLTWPAAWTHFATIPVTSFDAHATRVVEYEWTGLPGEGHYCLLARYVDTDDPMTYVETTDINYNVRYNNNIVWRNLNIIDASGADEFAYFAVTNKVPYPRLTNLVIRAPQAKSFLAQGRVSIELLPAMLNLWNSGGQQGGGFTREGPAVFHIGADGAVFNNLLLPANFNGRVRIRFGRKTATPRTTWMVDAVVNEMNGNGQFIRRLGGVSYEVHTEVNFTEGETFQH